MNNEIIFYIEDTDDGTYAARAIGYPIFTDGESIEELRSNIRDAVTCHFEEKQAPQIIRLHFVREEAIAL